MRTFFCDHCGHPLFFENVRCLKCGSDLAFLPHRLALCAIEPVAGGKGLWRRRKRRSTSQFTYRLCSNHTQQACNFAVPQDDPNPLCVSCRQTRVLPDLSVAGNHERWYKVERAKRYLFYTLAKLGLAAVMPKDGHDGPVFEFLADTPGHRVMTGHAGGVITLNIAEADDDERVKRRVQMHEPYRTLLGHLRHESGHFYWDRLIAGGGRLEAFRKIFGDERADYGQSLQRHYAAGGGGKSGWEASHVSAYATSHPWEDWAETWAHYLHMVDLLETAASYSTSIALPGDDEVEADEVINPFEASHSDFDALVQDWVPLTLLVNSLNRSLGQDDAYPFALSAAALEKLRFVHDVIHAARAKPAKPPAPSPAESCPAESTTAPS
ncbi:zinc-binding metallopeptidase family protein [Ramlibacter sp. PS4R-6]|uniref:zinc-binding metallopeptidase family protein n=1 Tax=Ramlibacter sp. PS4R-6 TaxID=3133438 RepID=UPI0030B78A2F